MYCACVDGAGVEEDIMKSSRFRECFELIISAIVIIFCGFVGSGSWMWVVLLLYTVFFLFFIF